MFESSQKHKLLDLSEIGLTYLPIINSKMFNDSIYSEVYKPNPRYCNNSTLSPAKFKNCIILPSKN